MFRKSGSWCSTQVDENGNHIPMFYGKCPRKCKVDDSTKHQKGRSLDGKYILHYSMNSRLNIFNYSININLAYVFYLKFLSIQMIRYKCHMIGCTGGCCKDVDCKGDRICENKKCVLPKPVKPSKFRIIYLENRRLRLEFSVFG